MTVAELIEELQAMPPYMQVYTEGAKLDEDGLKVSAVRLDRVKCKQWQTNLGTRAEEEFVVVVLETF